MAGMIQLRPDDVGYVSMPLFHSNALFMNWGPALHVGGSVALRERFTASGFVEDVFRYGATYWNYVGQPVHYVLEALSRAHGGDEARILSAVRDGRRYLYFVGRTDDWIRKDGENFGADSVVEMIRSWDAVDLAAAYGVPHPVSDEWVMVALKLARGREFDPDELYRHCRREVENGRDAKWIPDFVRVVDDFEWTETHKIKV